MTFLFIDTNVLLHYRRLEEIDWLNLTKSKGVVIILCPAVIRELDQHKVSHPQNKFRKRAQEIVTSLYSRHSGANSDVIQNGVRLEFLAEDPNIDFVAHKLNVQLADDWLIASAIDWKQKHPRDETKIVSADLGISIKAKAQGILALAPLENDKLAEELDADEKRIKKLQEEIAEIKNSQPELRLRFENGQGVIHFKAPPPAPFDPNQCDLVMTQVRSKHPIVDVPPESKNQAKSMNMTIGDLIRKGKQKPDESYALQWPREEYLRYNSELEAFYKSYEQYLKELHIYKNFRLRMINFAVQLENIGTSPAEDIDVHFHFPDGFRLFGQDDNNLPAPPQPPTPPEKVGTFKFNPSWIGAIQGIRHPIAHQPNAGPPPNVSPPSIRRTNSYDVRSHVKRAKHGYQILIARFIVAFDSFESSKSFKFDYRILAANLPKPTTGELSVVVEKEN